MPLEVAEETGICVWNTNHDTVEVKMDTKTNYKLLVNPRISSNRCVCNVKAVKYIEHNKRKTKQEILEWLCLSKDNSCELDESLISKFKEINSVHREIVAIPQVYEFHVPGCGLFTHYCIHETIHTFADILHRYKSSDLNEIINCLILLVRQKNFFATFHLNKFDCFVIFVCRLIHSPNCTLRGLLLTIAESKLIIVDYQLASVVALVSFQKRTYFLVLYCPLMREYVCTKQ